MSKLTNQALIDLVNATARANMQAMLAYQTRQARRIRRNDRIATVLIVAGMLAILGSFVLAMLALFVAAIVALVGGFVACIVSFGILFLTD